MKVPITPLRRTLSPQVGDNLGSQGKTEATYRNGELKDYHGRPAKVADDVVFYCYVLCDIDEKRYGEYLEDEEFSRIYSGRSYYRWFPKISAHIEFIDFDHLLNDTKVRNAIFFNLLNGKNPLERGPGEY